jgi:hypothetical protein
MALTRPRIGQLNTNVFADADPITVLHAGATAANVDVGFLMNRANGLVSNVALYWSESGNTFVTAFSSNTGITDTNISATSYTTITTGHHLPGANVTYSLGSTTQRWKDLWLSGTTIYLGGATISSPDANTVAITNQNGGSFSVTGSAAGQASGTFGNLIANSGVASTSTSTGALQVIGGAGIGGNLYVGGNLAVTGTTTFTNTETILNSEYATTIDATTVRASTIGNTGATLTGTLSTAAQPNVTSVGTLTGLTVSGNTAYTNTVYAQGIYDNGNRVLSTSTGAGNLAISGTAITLPATGPGATTIGSGTAIPVITTDAYGRIVALSSSSVSTTVNLSGTSGTGSVSGGGTLTFAGSNGITATISGSTVTIADILWQQANANLGTATTNINSINANVGSYYAFANANLSTQTTNFNTLTANVGSYENTTNANIGAQFNNFNTLNANVGAYQIWANANVASYQTAINSLYTNANANTAAYLTTATINTTGNITGGNITSAGTVTVGNLVVTGNTSLTNFTNGNTNVNVTPGIFYVNIGGVSIFQVTSAGLIMGAPISMGGFGISGLATPTNTSDAATKAYADGAATTSAVPNGDLGTLGGSAQTDAFGQSTTPYTVYDMLSSPTGSILTVDYENTSSGSNYVAKNPI